MWRRNEERRKLKTARKTFCEMAKSSLTAAKRLAIGVKAADAAAEALRSRKQKMSSQCITACRNGGNQSISISGT